MAIKNGLWKYLKCILSLSSFIVASILGFKQDEGFYLGKIKDSQGQVHIAKASGIKLGVPEAFAMCGNGIGCSGGNGACGNGIGCSGQGSGGQGECGNGIGCSGGGGSCGNGIGCTGQGSGGQGQCGNGIGCSGGGGSCGNGIGCTGQ